MRVVYGYQIFLEQRYGGISRYFCELAGRLAARDDCAVSVLAPAHVNRYLRQPGAARVVGAYMPRRLTRSGGVERLANHALSRLWLSAHRPHIVHDTYYSPRRLAPRRSRTVVTVYDMIFEKLPEFFPRSERLVRTKAETIRRADHVICISHHTKRDLLDTVPLREEDVSVVHLGHALRAGAGPDTPLATGPYVLYVGERGGYKNFLPMLRALASSAALRRGLRIVCFGGGTFSAAERAAITRLALPDGAVEQLGGDDDVLANLYAHAAALVYPSLYEGFGIPPLEAMSLGCPVVCSNASSLPEVVADAAELFDPTSVDSMRTAIDSVVGSGERSAALRASGLRRAEQFSWDRCADETYAVYRALV